MAGRRRAPSFSLAICGVLLALVASACSSAAGGDEGGGSFEATVAVLSSAGIAVYDDPGDGAPLVPPADPVSPVRLLSWQVEALWREAERFGGLTAAELDGLFVGGVDAEFEGVAVSPAAVIVAWAEGVNTPGARHARELLAGAPEWPDEFALEDRPVFSDLVLILFMSDVAVAGASLHGDAPEASGGPSEVVLAAGTEVLADVVGDACTRGIEFLSGSVAAAFDAVANLLTPPPINTGFGLFDALANAVVGAVVGAAHVVIRGAEIFVNDVFIGLTVGQVMKIVATIAGFVGALAHVTSLVKPWEVALEANPDPVRVALAPAVEGNTGSVTVSVTSGSDSWPDWMEKCARAAGRRLPNLRPEGHQVSWDFFTIPGPLAVGMDADGRLGSDGTARFEYVTTIQDVADPELRRGTAATTVYIVRDDAFQLADLLAEVLAKGTASLFPLLAVVPPVAEFVHAEARSLANKVLPVILEELHLLRRETSTRLHNIDYYVSRAPEPEPEPEPEPPDIPLPDLPDVPQSRDSCPFATTAQAVSLTGVGGLVLNQVLLPGDPVEGFGDGFPATSCTWHSGLEWIVIGTVWRGPMVAALWDANLEELDFASGDYVRIPVSGPWAEGFTFEIWPPDWWEDVTFRNSHVYARGGDLLVSAQVIGPLHAPKNAVGLAHQIWQWASQ